MGRALASLAEAIALAPWLATLYSNRAHLLESLRRSEDALRDARQAIAVALTLTLNLTPTLTLTLTRPSPSP